MRVIHVDSRSNEVRGNSTSFLVVLANTLDSERLRRVRVDGFRVSNVPAGVDTLYLGCGLASSVDLQGIFGSHDSLLQVPVVGGVAEITSMGIETWCDIPLSLCQSLDFTLRDQRGLVVPAESVAFMTFTLTLS